MKRNLYNKVLVYSFQIHKSKLHTYKTLVMLGQLSIGFHCQRGGICCNQLGLILERLACTHLMLLDLYPSDMGAQQMDTKQCTPQFCGWLKFRDHPKCPSPFQQWCGQIHFSIFTATEGFPNACSNAIYLRNTTLNEKNKTKQKANIDDTLIPLVSSWNWNKSDLKDSTTAPGTVVTLGGGGSGRDPGSSGKLFVLFSS